MKIMKHVRESLTENEKCNQCVALCGNENRASKLKAKKMAAAKRENRQRAMAEKGGVKINLCNVRK
jgi:hypothetical protein